MSGDKRSDSCPRCGFSRSDESECPKCGVVFAKLRAAPERPFADEEPQGSGIFTRRGVVWISVLLALGAVAIWERGRRAEVGTEGDIPTPYESGVRVVDAKLSRPPADRGMTLADPPVSSWVMKEYLADQEVISIDPWSESVDEGSARSQRVKQVYPWLEGADGFREAVQSARDRNTGLVVYFYTDWCGYCRQLERELLNNGTVDEYLRTLPRVRINPERGQPERSLARGYGVSGFPSLFVHASADRRPQKIRQHTREAGGWRLQRPTEFIASLRRAAG